jgi:hypothetical protein
MDNLFLITVLFIIAALLKLAFFVGGFYLVLLVLQSFNLI